MRNKLFCCVVFAALFLVSTSLAQLKIATNGSVGIGIDNPETHSKLHVQHNDYYAGYFTSSKLNSNTRVIRTEFTGNGSYNATAVYGRSVPTSDWGCGYGGYFEGGWKGVYAGASFPGKGDRYGVYTYASGGIGWNIGVGGRAYGDSGLKYGIYGYVSGSGTKYAGFFSGNVHATGIITQGSDFKLKENIKPVGAVLPKLMKLKAKTFNFKKGPEYEHMNLPSGNRYGLVAQDVEEIFPELVSIEVHPPEEELDESGELKKQGEPKEPTTYKGINYIEMIPILVEAIQEQQEQIEELKKEMRK